MEDLENEKNAIFKLRLLRQFGTIQEEIGEFVSEVIGDKSAISFNSFHAKITL